MGSSILGIATGSLIAMQRALATTGNNIANANTEGYTRQRVDLTIQTPQLTGAGYVGTGVRVEGVRRLYDAFLESQLRASIAARDGASTYAEFASQVDNILADPNTGLAPAMEQFFAAVQQVADDPTSMEARGQLLSQAGALVDRFRYVDGRLVGLQRDFDSTLTEAVSQANRLIQDIAALNEDIVRAYGAAGGQPPNDLLDKRDRLVLELSKLVKVTTVEQDDHALNVFIGKGQAAVIGLTPNTLEVIPGSPDGSRLEVGIRTGSGAPVRVSENLTGGKIGGLLDFRRQILEPSRDRIGRLAVVLGASFNLQHRRGQDLDGNLGGDFFRLNNPSDRIFPDLQGGSTATLAVQFDPATITELRASEYRASFDGTQWTVERLSDGTTRSGTGPITFDGMTFTFGGAAKAGDRFLVQPVRYAAQDLAVAVNDARQVAAALPVRLEEAVDANGVPTNQGTAAITDLAVVDPGAFSLPMTMIYRQSTGRFEDGSGNPLFTYDPATDAPKTVTLGGVRFTVQGAPADGDRFVIEANSGGVGDNGNAL
ncbi:MAG: flagellar hook-associated protein FlgK, partial [Gammaproteobacteria bacterium]